MTYFYKMLCLRLAACGTTQKPCPYVFYIDKVNDYGVPLSQQALRNVLDLNSCRERSSPGEQPL